MPIHEQTGCDYNQSYNVQQHPGNLTIIKIHQYASPAPVRLILPIDFCVINTFLDCFFPATNPTEMLEK